MPIYRAAFHCHSTKSDGALPPEEVYRWYHRAGWHVVALTDHRTATPPVPPPDLEGKLVALQGIEYNVTTNHGSVHVNGIGAPVLAEETDLRGTAGAVLAHLTAHSRATGAFTQINHPNWNWALAPEDFEGETQAHALEVWNASRACNNLGGRGRPSVEALWDGLLSKGRRIWATATDDAHQYVLPPQKRLWDVAGGAWIGIEAPSLTAPAILEAIHRGDFYASSGVDLEWVRREGRGIRLKVNPLGQQAYTIRWVTTGGRILREVEAMEDACECPAGEAYLRATVISSDGERAWTQPAFP